MKLRGEIRDCYRPLKVNSKWVPKITYSTYDDAYNSKDFQSQQYRIYRCRHCRKFHLSERFKE